MSNVVTSVTESKLQSPASTTTIGVPYEHQLIHNPEWALLEGSRHFEGKSAVFDALVKIAQRLDGLGIPYAIAGGMALFQHGFRRFTEDVDILVSRENLTRIHDELIGLGYLPAHRQSKHLRDTQLGVRIEFLTSGGYPGDGRPKPVAFPLPEASSIQLNGMNVLSLKDLIELKLASGISSPQRAKDLVDVQELISILELQPEYAEQLHPYVQFKFRELAAQTTRRFVLLWHKTGGIDDTQQLAGGEEGAQRAAEQLRLMLQDGVIIEDRSHSSGDDLYLVTTNPAIARKYDMVEESEFWPD